MNTPRLAQNEAYHPSPTFLPQKDEPLLVRIIKNIGQAMIHSLFHQGKEITEHADLFPRYTKEDVQKRTEEL
jgi:hypothetical protein